MNNEYPRVCANCKWAQIDTSDDARRYGGGCWCHRYPGNHPFVNESDWCAEFAVAYYFREMRSDLPDPPYQTHVAKGRFEHE